MRTLTWFTSVGMKSAPIPARAASTSRNVTAEASPRLWIPCRWKNSTAGFIASARKSEIRIQVTTCLEIQITSSTMATAMIVPSTVRIVRTGKRTSRSGTTRQGSRPRRTSRWSYAPECWAMSLRGEPIEATATLPDGRSVRVWIGVPEDSYIAPRELDTVDIELSLVGGNHLAAVNTVLEADQTSEATALAREIVAGLESGELEPTAAALEPLADQPR